MRWVEVGSMVVKRSGRRRVGVGGSASSRASTAGQLTQATHRLGVLRGVDLCLCFFFSWWCFFSRKLWVSD